MIRIAISRCLLGEAVRYDATDKLCSTLASLDPAEVEIIPFCPELESGMGVPRPPIHLVQFDDKIKVLHRDNHEIDVTEQLVQFSRTFAKNHSNINAIIAKKSSPSCGRKSTKLFNAGGQQISDHTNGVFINEMIQLFQDIEIVDEEEVDSLQKLLSFIQRIKQKSQS